MSVLEEQNTLVDSGARRVQSEGGGWAPFGESDYFIGERVASGGMGTVHAGLKQGALGFRRLLAIKRLHAHLSHDPDFVARFKDEIRVVSRLNHPNVVQTLDVVESAGELALVMEFVEGVTLHQLIKAAHVRDIQLPVPIAVGVVSQVLHGLHAAHELTDDSGHPIQLVHRDVSPQNIMIGVDGLVKVLDFGVAKATNETHVTRTGQLSGKAPYMSPEQVSGASIDRRTDVFAAGIVLWEALTGHRLFRPGGTSESAALMNVLDMRVKPPSVVRPEIGAALDRIVSRALDRDPTRRFGSARDFALALEEAVPEASLSLIANGVAELCSDRLAQNAIALPRGIGRDERGVVEAEDATGMREVVASSTSGSTDETRPIDAELLTCDVQGVPIERVLPRRFPSKTLIAGLASVALGVGAFAAYRAVPTSDHSKRNQSVSAVVDVDAEESAGHDGRDGNEPRPRVRVEVERRGPPAASEASPVIETRPLPTPAADAILEAQVPDDPSKNVVSPASKRTVAGRRSDSPSAKGGPSPISRNAPKGRVVSKERGEPVSVVNALAPNPPKKKHDCSPPTYVDADGIRHFRPECL